MTEGDYVDFLGSILAPSLHHELAHEVALGTIRALAVNGLAIVPLKPTAKMCAAGVPEQNQYSLIYAEACYRAMIAAVGE